jgi:hypothetical protein
MRTVRAFAVDEDSLDTLGQWQTLTTLFSVLGSAAAGAAFSAGLTWGTGSGFDLETRAMLKVGTILLSVFTLCFVCLGMYSHCKSESRIAKIKRETVHPD